MDTPSELAQLAAGMEQLSLKYYWDPVLFVQEIFKAEPTKQQIGVLQSLSSHKKVSVRAGHGVGKSTLASWAVFWFLLTRPESKIICTAPTFHQLYDVLWSEAAKWRRVSPLITSLFSWKQKRIECVLGPEDWWAAARTADKPEALAGRHAGHIMLLVDEASGIDDRIFEAAEGMLTSENSYALMLSNPTRSDGYFYRSHTRDKSLWSAHHLSCKDSPIVSERYVHEMGLKYGLDSNVYRVRVTGDFPLADDDVLIPIGWVEAAVNRDIEVTNEPLFFGVDVGAGGDKSVILQRRGSKVIDIKSHTTKNTMELLGWIALEAEKAKPAAIFVDPIGIGKGVYDRLAELNYIVYPVDVRMRARKPGFKRLRDELWWNTRTLFEKGLISIPNNEDLIGELSTIKYKPESDGTVKIEGKAELRRRREHSPDIADALCLTTYFEDRMFMDDIHEKYKSNNITKFENQYRADSHSWMTA